MNRSIQGLTAAFALVIAPALALPAAARGDGEDPRTVLAGLLEASMETSPLLDAHRSMATGAGQIAASADALPDPVFRFGYSPVALETRGGPQRARASLEQRFPYFGKRGLRREIAGEEAARLGHVTEGVAAEILRDVKEGFWEIYRIDRAIEIAGNERVLLGGIVAAAEAKYSTGSGDQATILQAQLLQTQIETRLVLLDGGRTAEVERLAGLIGGEVAVPKLARLADPIVEIDSSDAIDEALRMNPGIGAAEDELQKAEFTLDLAGKDGRPDFSLSAAWFEVGESDIPSEFSGRDAWSVGAALTIPIYTGDIGDRKRAAQQSIRAAQSKREDARRRVAATVRGILRRIESTSESIRLYETGLLPQAQSTFESAMASYGTGELDFANLVLAETSLLDIELGYHESVARHRQLVAALDQAIGRSTPGGLQ